MRRLLALLVVAAVARGGMADDAVQPVLDAFKAGKMFDKSEYKAVRGAAAKVFEARQAEVIKSAFGPEHAALSAWLDKQKDLKEEFYSAIHPQRDNIAKALAVFRDLWKEDAAAVAKYPNLAIALAVVWDAPENVYDYRPHQVRTKSILPPEYMDYGPVNEFKYHVGHAKAVQGKEAVSRLEVLPWEFLVYVVDHRTPTEERDWAVKNYLPKRPMIGEVYKEIVYDTEMLRTRSEVCKLNGRDYSLQAIKNAGGVCAMQADFAARVGKTLAVPAAYVGGQSQDLGLHAWVMWVEVKSATRENVNFALKDYGRYADDKYYTGYLRDPQTGEAILDRDMERRLAAAAVDRIGKRQAELAMQFYADVAAANNFDAKKKIQYLDGALKLAPHTEAAWQELARMAREKEVTGDLKSTVFEHADRLLVTFAKYPDFSWKVANDLMSLQTDKFARNRFFDQLAAMYERASRPDLACEARLKWADLLAEDHKFPAIAEGLAAGIKKFPNEGRYVPKLLSQMKKATDEFKGGKDYLGRTYLDLILRMDPKRGDEVTKYFILISTEALSFFEGEKKVKEANEVKKKMRSLGVKVPVA